MKVKAIEMVRHNGVRHMPGTIFDTSEKEAKRLDKLGAAHILDDKPEEKESEKAVTEMNISEIEEIVENIEDIEILKAMLEEEEESERTRIGAQNAINNRIKELEEE